ncbi:MAG: VWA domain-containing protein, partial [Myxococcota bacterium]|nr:VWA domain-containing protein [Myxococcota bacterium]
MKRIIFSLAFMASACMPESGDSEGEASNVAGTAVVGSSGGQASTAGVVASRGGEVAANGAGQASAVAGDCRNAAMACSAGFECRLDDDGRYECLPPAPQSGEPAQPTAGEMVSGGQPEAAGDTVGGMSSAAGEALAGGQSMAGASNAGQPASAGMPSQAGVPVSGETMAVMAGMSADVPNLGQPMAGAPAPEACYGVRPIEVRPGNPMPGAIAAAFEVSTCMNAPAPNLVEADFALFENGEPIDAVEASRTILDRKAAAFVTIVLDNSPSVAAANAVDAVADAALAYVTTALTDTEQVYVSVASFSRRFTVLAPYSNDLEALRAAIEAYRADGSGSNTTNLYGSYIEALTASTTAQAELRTRDRDGLVTFGEVLFLTDGNDNAGVNDLADAQAALSNTTDEVLVVGLGNVDAIAVNALSTTDGALAVADDVSAIFSARVTRILHRQQSIYVLGYCSPKLRGMHDVTVAIDGAPGVELLNFNADGWLDYDGPECSRAAFTDGCTDAA